MRFGGALESNLQLGISSCCELINYRNQNVLTLTVEAQPHERVDVQGSLSLRNLNFTAVEDLDDLGRADVVQPINFRVNEAYVALYGVGVEGGGGGEWGE